MSVPPFFHRNVMVHDAGFVLFSALSLWRHCLFLQHVAIMVLVVCCVALQTQYNGCLCCPLNLHCFFVQPFLLTSMSFFFSPQWVEFQTARHSGTNRGMWLDFFILRFRTKWESIVTLFLIKSVTFIILADPKRLTNENNRSS